VASTLGAVAAHETHLVLPLGLAPREAEAAVARFGRLGADRLLVTKTDEARFAGPLLELAVRTGVPLSYVGEGPLVPGDLRAADGGSIAARILPI
jgi:flagellar biosynthesis protein FlhF